MELRSSLASRAALLLGMLFGLATAGAALSGCGQKGPRAYGTPLYVYSRSAMREAAAAYQRRWPAGRTCCAMR
jgi:hypothetical protein